MDSFWLTWAAQEARDQWFIYFRERGNVPPSVKQVVPDPEKGCFLVRFEDGTALNVRPSGLANIVR